MCPSPQPVEPTGGQPVIPGDVRRRAPFSDNPDVGPRGQRTHDAIVDAALEAFKESGYHRTNIALIAEGAGCSRASFYQYFSSKAELLSHLGSIVAAQVEQSTEVLGEVGPDRAGRDELRAWIARHGELYQRYEPVFAAFQETVDTDEALAGWAKHTRRRNTELFGERLALASRRPEHLGITIDLILAMLTTTENFAGFLREVTPESHQVELVNEALADVIHRSLFGLIPDVNDGEARRPAPADLQLLSTITELTDSGDLEELSSTRAQTRDALVAAGQSLLVERGFHSVRIDDIVAEAGVSHGAFYRYFDNKEELANLAALGAMSGVSQAFGEIGALRSNDSLEAGALRNWLKRYNDAYTAATAMIQVWIEANRQQSTLRTDSAAVLDWGRQRMVEFLGDRGFGDPGREALILVALLSTFGRHQRDADTIDAALALIERGFLGN